MVLQRGFVLVKTLRRYQGYYLKWRKIRDLLLRTAITNNCATQTWLLASKNVLKNFLVQKFVVATIGMTLLVLCVPVRLQFDSTVRGSNPIYLWCNILRSNCWCIEFMWWLLSCFDQGCGTGTQISGSSSTKIFLAPVPAIQNRLGSGSGSTALVLTGFQLTILHSCEGTNCTFHLLSKTYILYVLIKSLENLSWTFIHFLSSTYGITLCRWWSSACIAKRKRKKSKSSSEWKKKRKQLRKEITREKGRSKTWWVVSSK